MSAWEELIATALIGTERRPLPALTPGYPTPGEPPSDRPPETAAPAAAAPAAAAPAAAAPAAAPGDRARGHAAPDDPARAAAELLDRAALLVAARRAGQLLGRGEPLPPAGPDNCPEVSLAAGRRLARILAGEHSEVLPEWLDAAAVRSKRAPGHLLPALLDRARGDREIRSRIPVVGGARAFWLAELNPAWSYLALQPAREPRTEPAKAAPIRAGATTTGTDAAPAGPKHTPTPTDTQATRTDAGPAGAQPTPAGTDAAGSEPAADEPPGAHPIWQFGRLGERRGYLSSLRASDPAAATELIAATWDAASPDEKAVYLAALLDRLGPSDEPLLERALDESRLEIRQRAADLLSRIPGTALGRRMAERALACLRVERSLRGARLLAEPPSRCDAAMRRDGIMPRPPSGRDSAGERAWWLAELLARTPLRTWVERFGMRPAEMVALRMDEWGPQVIAGWARAAVAQQDCDWARALLARGLAGKLPGAGTVREVAPLPPGFAAGGLIAVLPPAEQATAATALTRSAASGDALPALLSGVPGPWGERLATAVLDAAAKEEAAAENMGWHSRAAASLYRLAAQRLDPVLGAPGGLLSRRADADGEPPPALHALALTLRFRYEMLRELDE